MTALYLCYQSLLDPLTQRQVVAYLEGLARAGYPVVLLTYEDRALRRGEAAAWRQRLAGKGITWYWHRYHKRPTVPATAWDVLAGIVTGLWLIRRHGVRLLHARGHVAGLMALVLKRITGAKLLFDVRGLMAEEYVDKGIWPEDSALVRITKRVERSLMRASDQVVVLTDRAKTLLSRWYPEELSGKTLSVIPCCVDLDEMRPRTSLRPAGRSSGPKTIVYVGKLGGWCLTDAMAAFMAAAAELIPGLRWQVWTQSDPRRFRQAIGRRGLAIPLAVGTVPAEQLPDRLAEAHAGLALIKPCLSNIACSPTKVGEYLAAGLPVITNPGIGDLDGQLNGAADGVSAGVGVFVPAFSQDGYRQAARRLKRLLDDANTPARCRAVAGEHFDLRRVGWPRYCGIYESLIGGGRKT